MKNLNCNAAGLSSNEVESRLVKYGPNQLQNAPKHYLKQLVHRLSNPLIIILVLASLVSFFSGETTGFFLITAIVVFSLFLDFIQQYRSERATEKLKLSVALKVEALRDGKKREVLVTTIVPGDIIFLSSGDVVPADGVIIEEKDLFINQALLTGEGFPAEKKALLQEPTRELYQAVNALFGGTSVVSGSAKVLICCTGYSARLGEISKSLEQPEVLTAFDHNIHRLGYLIMRVTVALVLFVLLVNLLLNRPLLESFLFAVALAVGLTPELLPMIITLSLTKGALRMAKKRVVVKRLSAIQNLGSMDLLCSDKTGTLTEGSLRLQSHVNFKGVSSESILKLAYLNSYFETGYKSPIDKAILDHQQGGAEGWDKIDEVPFDFERRRISVLLKHQAERYLIVKGAPEDIISLSRSASLEFSAEAIEFVEFEKKAALRICNSLESEGLRVVAVAWKRVEGNVNHAGVSDEMELVFAGFVAFHDPPKKDVNDVLAGLAKLNVSFVLITGDSELVARHLFNSLDLAVTGVLTGVEIDSMEEVALQIKVAGINLFCRVSPMQKLRILQAFKKRGHVVGFLGDGANDAPSLIAADVGISVESAVDVAKEAADIVLLKPDLETLNLGIIEGRTTHVNIMKYLMMATSSNFGNMISMAFASLFLPFLPMLPLQVLLNNFLYDLSETAIPLDRVDPQAIFQPTKWNIQLLKQSMWVFGLVSSFFDLITFFVLTHFFKSDAVSFHTAWFIESISTQVLVIFVIRTSQGVWQSKPSVVLCLTSLTVVALACWLPFSPVAQDLGFTKLSLQFYVVLLGIVLSYLGLVEVVKRNLFRQLSVLNSFRKID